MIVDDRLIRRLESSAARTGLDLVDSLNADEGGPPADGVAALGGALVAMGPGRYVNRAIGITLDELSAADLDMVEEYYGERRLTSQVELSSWAPEPTVAALAARGYVPAWFRSVFATPVMSDVPYRMSIAVRPAAEEDHDTWAAAYTEGSVEVDGDDRRAAATEFALAMLRAANTHALLATVDGTVAGCAAVQIIGDVAWLGAAATLPEFRGQGVQAALVAHRLRLARRVGCGVGAATAVPASTSARNLIRLGFQPTHTQVVVERRRG